MAKDKVSAKVKAQRRQHRKDHFTDADRKLFKDNKGNQKARVAARKENFAAQGNKSAADFDFDQHGKGHIGQQEISHLRKQGHSKEDIMAAATANGGELSARTQKRFARWNAAKEKAGNQNPGTTGPINPQAPANETNVETNVENTQEQTVNQDNDQSSTIVGDNNTVEQNQDNSVDQQGANNKTGVSVGDAGQTANLHVMPADYSSANADAEAQKLADSYIDTIRPGTTTNMDTDIKNTQKQDITQDNDQSSTITGDNNTVWQQQDNSIRQYGGDNRSFVYNGGNSGVDTPVSAATMGGFYDVDDSPAAQAKFHDLHTTLNDDYQKQYSGMGMRVAGMFSNFDARGYDPAQLETNIASSALRSYDRATVANNDVFGDMDRNRGTLSEYKFGAEPKTVDYDDDDDEDD